MKPSICTVALLAFAVVASLRTAELAVMPEVNKGCVNDRSPKGNVLETVSRQKRTCETFMVSCIVKF